MGQEKRQPPPEEAPSAPLWMVTFSDCMNLLLTFFILLMTFSSFTDEQFVKLRTAFQKALPTISLKNKEQKNAVLPTQYIMYVQNPNIGSEKPTLANGEQDNLKEETEPTKFRDRKVFLISSDKVFYGNGAVISLRGRKALSAMASFLKEMPDRVVISENSLNGAKNNENLGVDRAWAVIEYMTKKQSLDKQQFSISAGSMTTEGGSPKIGTGRMLEITLLERSLYK